jgi:hypothetical protein
MARRINANNTNRRISGLRKEDPAQVNERAETINLSSFTGLGVDQLVERIVGWKE